MKITEGIDYTRTGWREGEVATAENEPSVIRLDAVPRSPYGQWNNHVVAVGVFRSQVRNAWEATLSDEQKAEKSAKFERDLMAEAQDFYARQPAGSQKSFWD